MGVKLDEDQRIEVNRMLELPDDEPLFIIRGQDALAVPAIARYQVLAIEADCDADFIRGLNELMSQFAEWQSEHAGHVKKPD